MNKEFISLVVLSAFVGCPIGWLMMSEWLEGYAYKVEVGYITLVVAAFICLAIAVLTVSYHSLRVASANPAKSLRYE